jgi:glycerophosphoryl diester phosphodiesterase
MRAPITALAGALLLILGYAWHGGRATGHPLRPLTVLAHRGAHTAWDPSKYHRRTGCEASHLVPPVHSVIENTIESIASAFDAGATMVEIDIRLTKDQRLAVFHDSDLACRTDGTGRVQDHDLPELQKLDIGYGYTLQGTSDFPFRGKGRGRLPSLEAVLAHFPDRHILIDHKDQSRASAIVLGTVLAHQPAPVRRSIQYWGPRHTFAEVSRRAPGIGRLLLDRTELRACLMPYLLTLGASGLGDKCRHEGIGLPYSYARILWGWPHRFLQEAHSIDARVYILTDSPDDARDLALLPIDGVITDNILEVGPAIRRTRKGLASEAE